MFQRSTRLACFLAAFAQNPPAAAADLVPPTPRAPLRAAYPEGAVGDAVVVLLVTVDREGGVRAARVIEGEEPFARAAREASAGFHFAPATRDDKPIEVTIRVRIEFRAPSARTVPSEASRAPTGPGAVVGPPSAPLEVTVQGELPTRGAASLSTTEVTLIPGAFGDPFRAVEALPGVTPIVSGLPFFYIRGAPPGDVGYFLDGVRVPFLFHVGLGPSVVAPALIDHVDLHAGAYPAQFGRYAGGIVSGTTVPPETEWHAAGELRLVDVGARVGGPFANGQGSVFAAARYSYTAAILSLVSPSVALGYWDYQVRASYRPTSRDEVGVFVFGSHDHLGSKDVTGEHTSLDTTFHRVDLRYDRRLGGPEDRLRQAITFGYDETEVEGGLITDRLLGARTEIQKRLSTASYPRVLLRAGLDAEVDVYEGHRGQGLPVTADATSIDGLLKQFLGAKNTTLPFTGRNDITAGAYAEAVVRPGPRVEVTPGVRLDFFGSPGTTARVAIDPRVTTRLALSTSARLVAAVGLASQPPSFALPLPGFQESLAGGLQRTLQASLGVEASLPEAFEATVTLFQDTFWNLTDPIGNSAGGTLNALLAAGSSTAGQEVSGWSAGVEFGLRRRLTRHLGMILAYTLSRSARLSVWGQLSDYDRTHVVSAATLFDFGHGVKGGTRILGYSGSPYYGLALQEHRPRPRYITVQSRLAPFFRLDVRLEKRWALPRSAWISTVFEVENALFAEETTYGVTNGPTDKLGPITLPSLGVEAGF
jgi:TonB family protein